MIPIIWYSGKVKTMETVKKQQNKTKQNKTAVVMGWDGKGWDRQSTESFGGIKIPCIIL